MVAVQQLELIAQHCMSGDATVDAIRQAVKDVPCAGKGARDEHVFRVLRKSSHRAMLC